MDSPMAQKLNTLAMVNINVVCKQYWIAWFLEGGTGADIHGGGHKTSLTPWA